MKAETIISIFVITLFAAIFAVELALLRKEDISIKDVFRDLEEWLVAKLKDFAKRLEEYGKRGNDE